MAVRNFWIETKVDGRKTTLTGGPQAKGGGFEQTIYIRQNGGSLPAMRIVGETSADGWLLYLRAIALVDDADVIGGRELLVESAR
jgi:hypothetical protein